MVLKQGTLLYFQMENSNNEARYSYLCSSSQANIYICRCRLLMIDKLNKETTWVYPEPANIEHDRYTFVNKRHIA